MNKKIIIHEYTVTNDGKVLLMMTHYDQEGNKGYVKKDGKKIPAYKVKALVYEDNKPDATETIVDLGDKFPNFMRIGKETNDNIVLFGIYRIKDEGLLTGFYTMKYQKATGKIEMGTINDFSKELIWKTYKEKQLLKDKADTGISYYYNVEQRVKRDDGSSDFILQYRETISHEYKGRTYYSYLYRDIIDICFSPDNKVTITRLPFYQETALPAFCGFQAVPYKDNLLLFYNDNPKNLLRHVESSPIRVWNFKKTDFIVTKIDCSGNIARTSLYPNNSGRLITALGFCYPVYNNVLVLCAQSGMHSKGNKNKVGYLKID